MQLGLHRDSVLPKFTKDLTLEQVKVHPEINSWHEHRRKMEGGHISQDQLPPHFQPTRWRKKAKFRFSGEASSIADNEMSIWNKPYRTDQSTRTSSNLRAQKMKELKLHAKSALPSFAHGVPLQEVKEKMPILLADWHRHREMLEKGHTTKEDLPPHFQTVKGGFRFIDTGMMAKVKALATKNAREKWKARLAGAANASDSIHDHSNSGGTEDPLNTSHQQAAKSPPLSAGPSYSEAPRHSLEYQHHSSDGLSKEEWEWLQSLFP